MNTVVFSFKFGGAFKEIYFPFLFGDIIVASESFFFFLNRDRESVMIKECVLTGILGESKHFDSYIFFDV